MKLESIFRPAERALLLGAALAISYVSALPATAAGITVAAALAACALALTVTAVAVHTQRTLKTPWARRFPLLAMTVLGTVPILAVTVVGEMTRGL